METKSVNIFPSPSALPAISTLKTSCSIFPVVCKKLNENFTFNFDRTGTDRRRNARIAGWLVDDDVTRIRRQKQTTRDEIRQDEYDQTTGTAWRRRGRRSV